MTVFRDELFLADYSAALLGWDGTHSRRIPGLLGGGALYTYGNLLIVANGYDGGVSGVFGWDGVASRRIGVPTRQEYQGYAIAALAYKSELVVGGEFTEMSGVPAQAIARWDGTRWDPLGSGLLAAGGGAAVTDLAVLGDDLIAVGYFDSAGGVPANGIARWNGLEWDSLGTIHGNVGSVAVHDGALLASGSFDIDGAFTTLARWDGVRWSAFTPEPPSVSLDPITEYGGDLVATGRDGALWRFNGLEWDRIGELGRADYSGQARAMAEFRGRLCLAGDFTSVGDVPASGLAFWDGRTWEVRKGAGVSGYWVGTLLPHHGSVIAGGDFFWAGAAPTENIARWDGYAWSAVGVGLRGDVAALAAASDTVFAGGPLYSFAPSFVARWDGTAWADLPAPNDRVLALAMFQGALYAGGEFDSAGGLPASHVARWDGMRWAAVGQGLDGPVFTLGEYGGRLVAGGDFNRDGSNRAHGVSLWDGARWTSLGDGPRGTVYCLFAHGAELFAGGYLSDVDGAPVGVMRWSDGRWTPVGAGVGGTVRGMTLDAAGDLVVVGSFTRAGYASARNIARWNSLEGWQAIGSGVGENTGDHAYAVTTFDGDLWVGGDFTAAGGKPSLLVARWTEGIAPSADIERPWLSSVFPNPTTAGATISYVLPRRGPVRVTVYDARGALRATLVDGEEDAGRHMVIWAGAAPRRRAAESGIFVAVVEFERETLRRKFVRLK